jgi:hypothetical protein
VVKYKSEVNLFFQSKFHKITGSLLGTRWVIWWERSSMLASCMGPFVPRGWRYGDPKFVVQLEAKYCLSDSLRIRLRGHKQAGLKILFR